MTRIRKRMMMTRIRKRTMAVLSISIDSFPTMYCNQHHALALVTSQRMMPGKSRRSAGPPLFDISRSDCISDFLSYVLI